MSDIKQLQSKIETLIKEHNGTLSDDCNYDFDKMCFNLTVKNIRNDSKGFVISKEDAYHEYGKYKVLKSFLQC